MSRATQIPPPSLYDVDVAAAIARLFRDKSIELTNSSESATWAFELLHDASSCRPEELNSQEMSPHFDSSRPYMKASLYPDPEWLWPTTRRWTDPVPDCSFSRTQPVSARDTMDVVSIPRADSQRSGSVRYFGRLSEHTRLPDCAFRNRSFDSCDSLESRNV